MTRPLETLTALAFDKPVLPLAAIISLDIENDPLYCWSGIGDLVFTAAQTGDPSLDGFTFKGTGNLIQISNVSEGVGGSDVLEVALPGVDINEPMLRQLITFRRRWQFRRAVVWLMALDEVTGAIAGKPFRIKTGRMDRMPLSESKGNGVVKCRIEGQQAYGNIPLGTRYSEQRDLNPNDNSQEYVHSLANMKAKIGVASGSGSPSAGIPGGGGSNSFFSNLGIKVV